MTDDDRGVARSYLRETAEAMGRVEVECLDDIVRAAAVLVDSLSAGGALLICGNGGSAADAQHLATEFVSTLTIDHPRPAIRADRAHDRHVAAHGDLERLRGRRRLLATGRGARARRRRADRDLDERRLVQRGRGRRGGARTLDVGGRPHRIERGRAGAVGRRRDPRAVDGHGAHPGMSPRDRAAPRAPRGAVLCTRAPDGPPACRCRPSPSPGDGFPAGARRFPPIQTTLELRRAAVRGHVLRRRPRDHRRLSRRRRDHRDRRREVPRRRAARLVPGARQSSAADPAIRRAPHRHRRPHGLAGAPDRAGPAVVPGVRPRIGLRRAQRPVRLRVPERVLRRARLSARSRARRCAPRASPGASSGPTCRTCGSRRSRGTSARRATADASRARRRRGVRRGAARAARSRRPPRHPRALGDLEEAVRARGRPNFGKIAPRRRSPPRAGRVPVPRRATAACSTSARPTTCAHA